MVRSKGSTATVEKKEILSQSELQGLQEEKRDLENSINDARESQGASRNIDVAAAQAKIRRIDHAIEIRTPDNVRGLKKDSLVREEREIEDKLIEGMPTRYEMEHPNKCPGAVRKHMSWDFRNKALIQRYVEIQRVLRPEEPKSIEELRTEGGPRR